MKATFHALPPARIRASLAQRLRRVTVRGVLETAFWLLLLGFVGRRMWPQLAAAVGVDAARAAAPAWQLTTLAGEPISSESLRGRVVLVNFWATWCPPCRVEMPGFQRVYERAAARGFTVVGISTDALGADHVAAFVRERGVTYPIAMASAAVVRDFGGAGTLPTSFLIDRQGRIRYQVTGVFTSVALERAVDRLLAEGEPTGGPAVAEGR